MLPGFAAAVCNTTMYIHMTSLPIVGYAQSSGSVGSRKFVPLTQPEVNLYTRYTVTRMMALPTGTSGSIPAGA